MSAFFFAWVDATDTAWLSAYEREDLDVLSYQLDHVEGDFPILKLEVRNPYEGLLAPGRKVWGWFADNTSGTPQPLFFGRLQGTPDDLFAEVITLQFIARSYRYLMYKQALAETLMVPPYYDPVFVDPKKRDDPDTVLEGYSYLYHWDRLPSGSPADLAVTVSDVLNGEDGTVVFTADDVFYDSVHLKIGQQPLTKLKMRADVNWTQRTGGSVDFGTRNLSGIWTGGSLISEWPKPGTQLQGGWTVRSSYAIGDSAQYGTPSTLENHWQNTEKQHEDGDTMSKDESITIFPCDGDAYQHDFVQQIGLVDPWGISASGEQGINIPAKLSWGTTLVCKWTVQLSLALEYEAIRPHSETIEFELDADLQPILTDPNTPASLDTEIVTLNGGDVSLPVVHLRSWFALFLSGETVKLGTVVESSPEYVGTKQYSICIQEGTVGSSEPAWSDILGAAVYDGSVVWASLGTGGVPTDFPSWKDVADSEVVLGTVVASNWFLPAPLDTMGFPIPAPAAGISSFQICTQAGITQKYSDPLGDGLADTNPNHPEPNFSDTYGVTTADNTVIWTSLGDGSEGNGNLDIPIGLKTAASSYFPSTRGNTSIGYLLGVARAHILYRSRCIEATFECPLDKALNLSCRKNVLLYDPRLPGGQILGKVKSYSFFGHGDKQTFFAKVTIAASVGLDNTITTTPGTPVYVDDGYVAASYQYYSAATVAVSVDDNDVGYTPPFDQLDADGVRFPASLADVVVKDEFITGTPPGAAAFLANTFFTFIKKNTTVGIVSNAIRRNGVIVENIAIPNGYTHTEIPTDRGGSRVVLYPITQYYLELKPMQGVSFAKQYNITVTNLTVPKMIDLEAPATP